MIENIKKLFGENNKQNEVEVKNEVEATPLAVGVVAALGGIKNIRVEDACATRLRVELRDMDLLNEEELKALGSAGVVRVENNGVQAIFAAKAKDICKYIQFIKREKDLVDGLAVGVVAALGGQKNIRETDACATRLRVVLADQNLVNEKELKELGAAGVVKVGDNGVHAIFGAKAKDVSEYIEKILGE